LLPEHLPDNLHPQELPKPAASAQTLEHVEGELIREASVPQPVQSRGHSSRAGNSQTTLWRKMKKLGLELP